MWRIRPDPWKDGQYIAEPFHNNDPGGDHGLASCWLAPAVVMFIIWLWIKPWTWGHALVVIGAGMIGAHYQSYKLREWTDAILVLFPIAAYFWYIGIIPMLLSFIGINVY